MIPRRGSRQRATCARWLVVALITVMGSHRATAQCRGCDEVLTFGLAGWHTASGTTASADALMTGDQLAFGIRAQTQPLRDRDRRAYAGMILVGVSPANALRFARFDLGFGFVGQSSRRALRAHQYIGVGYSATVTVRAFADRLLQPEASAWAVGATSAQFTGYAVGLRIRPPTRRR